MASIKIKKWRFNSLRMVLTIVLILVGVISTAIMYFMSSKGDITTDITWIERLYYSVQIVTGIYVVIGAVVGVWQYCISTRSEIIKNESDKVCKAIDLAGYYKDNIIIPFSSVKYVYDKIGATDIIKAISKEKMVNFDTDELNDTLSEHDLKALKESAKTPEFVKAVQEANHIYNLNMHESSDPICDDLSNTITDNASENDLASIIATSYMLGQMRDLLNNLEYFAMFFTHNIADESVVFQSLHQSYFNVVETMYHHISSINTVPNHKYYVNTIELYKEWKKKDRENQRNIENAKQAYNDSLQQHNIGTVPENFKIK